MNLRPQDSRRVQQQMGSIYNNAAHKVLWKEVSSTTGGAPEYGIEPTVTYRQRTVDALIATPRIDEMQNSGGMILEGDLWMQLRTKPGLNDHFVWDSDTYEMVSDPTPIRLGNAIWYRFVIRRAS